MRFWSRRPAPARRCACCAPRWPGESRSSARRDTAAAAAATAVLELRKLQCQHACSAVPGCSLFFQSPSFAWRRSVLLSCPPPAGRTEGRGGAAAAPQQHACAGPAGEAGEAGREGRGHGSASARRPLQHLCCWPSTSLTHLLPLPFCRRRGCCRPCAAGGVGGAPGDEDGGGGGRQRPASDHLQLPHPLAAAAGHAGAQKLQLQVSVGGCRSGFTS